MSDDIVRIGADDAPEQKGTVNLREMVLRRRSFENPYDSREEYRRRERVFIDAQAEIAASIGASIDDLAAHDHDLFPVIGWSFEFNRELKFLVANGVFGDLWRQGDVEIYSTQDDEAYGRITSKGSRFVPGRIFFIDGIPNGEHSRSAYTLNSSHLTPQQSADAAERAFELFDRFEFARTHYAKFDLYNSRNPFKGFLDTLITVGTRMNPERFAGHFTEGKSLGWIEEDEDGYFPSGLYVDINPADSAAPLLMTNVTEEEHGDLIQKGDLLRYTARPIGHDWFSTGTLISIVDK